MATLVLLRHGESQWNKKNLFTGWVDVGSRPCTADGLPLIGPTRSPRVFVTGGHGMWGIALGPLTAKLLARRIATGLTPDELVAFDPLR